MHKKYRPATDADTSILNPAFAPRTAQEIPTTAIDDSPTYCFEINEDWLPHILGVLSALDQPDAWLGTESEIEAARDQIRKLMTSDVCP